MRKAYKYRLYPKKKQVQALETQLETHRLLYNRALAERKETYEQEQRNVSYAQQSAHLKEDRVTNPYLQQTNFSSCQATLRRLDKAFERFFERVKSGKPLATHALKARIASIASLFPPMAMDARSKMVVSISRISACSR